ncbi:Cell wall protein 1 [Spathaspora sp. JA1]|nr:Cell wall protein 1 [Spathaspora sp. JA1]
MKISTLVLLSISIVYGVEGADTTEPPNSEITPPPDADEPDNPYTQYPSVAKTASINGFADRIYADMPECAKPCMYEDTGKTPCPYWDTGCLCIMPQFAGGIGNCIADNCKGQDVVVATSLGVSICSVAGVWEPYWMPPATVRDRLDAAATEEPPITTDDAVETTEEPVTTETDVEPAETTEEPVTTETDVEPAETTEPDEITTPPDASETETPPPVIRTASINGFADRIYDDLPECAKPCMYEDTGKTPCPYWDTGCLCVMPQFAGGVGNCVADSCKGQDVDVATSLASSICSVAGVRDPYWMIPATVKDLLDAAATEEPPTTSDDAVETSVLETTEDPVTTETDVEPAQTTEPAEITTPPDASETETPPPVIRTASINGFADRIYDDLPECAKPCMYEDTGKTPCPYWDTGCLCVMPQFAGGVGNCVADSCKGQDVDVATSLASSICSVAGVRDPYWMIPATVKDLLDAAATEEPPTTSDDAAETSALETTEDPVTAETDVEPVQTTEPAITTPPDAAETENPYTQYPSVARTASINGFADRIYDDLPECAKPCMYEDTGKTPCPYWDTGCLCIMPQFAGGIGNCIADSCKGQDVVVATSLGVSICSVAGVWEPYWMLPATVQDRLDAAATEEPPITTDAAAETSALETTEDPVNTDPIETTEIVEPTEPAITTPPDAAETENPYSQYPSVARTASINGFADRIYEDLPECAKPCMYEDTGKTPCPYWDTGCLCIMPQFAGGIGNCIADSCKGQDVVVATSLGTSICSVAGVWEPYWMLPATVQDRLDAAATEELPITTDAAVETTALDTTEDPVNTDVDPVETTEGAVNTDKTTETTKGAATTDDAETSDIVEKSQTSAAGEASQSTTTQSDSLGQTHNKSSDATGTETVGQSDSKVTTAKTVSTGAPSQWNSTSTEVIFKTITNVIEHCETNIPCITSIISSCEEEIKSLESVQSSASEAGKTEIVTSCEAAKSSLSSIESCAEETLKELTVTIVETRTVVGASLSSVVLGAQQTNGAVETSTVVGASLSSVVLGSEQTIGSTIGAVETGPAAVVADSGSGKYTSFTGITGVFMLVTLVALV